MADDFADRINKCCENVKIPQHKKELLEKFKTIKNIPPIEEIEKFDKNQLYRFLRRQINTLASREHRLKMKKKLNSDENYNLLMQKYIRLEEENSRLIGKLHKLEHELYVIKEESTRELAGLQLHVSMSLFGDIEII